MSAPTDSLSSRIVGFAKRRWALGIAIGAGVLLLLWIALARPFSPPYTVVNAGDGKVYKVNRRTGESWLLSGSQEIPVTDQSMESDSESSLDTAVVKAKQSDVLAGVFPNYPSSWSNASVIRGLLEDDHSVKAIKGWNGLKIDEDTYLVSFRYENSSGSDTGLYFEVNLNADIVRNIFVGTPLFETYEKSGIKPTYRLAPDGKSVVSEDRLKWFNKSDRTTNEGGETIWDDWKDDPIVGNEAAIKSQ
jgi:hypothetical protein